MNEKIQTLWNGLDRKIFVSKRELVLGVTACSLAGVLLGMLLSPRKTVTIGSNNGGNIHDHRTTPQSQAPAASTDVEAAAE